MSAPETFNVAIKKNDHDAFTGGVNIVPRTFRVGREGGSSVNIISAASPDAIDYTKNHPVSQSSSPFMPSAGSTTSAPAGSTAAGRQTYGYRRIPFVHKLGGSHIQASIGNTKTVCEILRLNLGKVFPNVMNPYNHIELTYITFPFGRTVPLQEENTQIAADNFVHALGNQKSTRLYKQSLTWNPKHPADPDQSWTIYESDSTNGNITASYTPIEVDDSQSTWNSFMMNTMQCVYDNNMGIYSGVANNQHFNYHTNNPIGNTIWIHPLLFDPHYYILTPYAPGGYADNNGPIDVGSNVLNIGSTPYQYVYPFNPVLGINTIESATPQWQNNYPALYAQYRDLFPNGTQGHGGSGGAGSPNYGDLFFKGNPERGGIILKGIIEIY